jgi:hypothetical protein
MTNHMLKLLFNAAPIFLVFVAGAYAYLSFHKPKKVTQKYKFWGSTLIIVSVAVQILVLIASMNKSTRQQAEIDTLKSDVMGVALGGDAYPQIGFGPGNFDDPQSDQLLVTVAVEGKYPVRQLKIHVTDLTVRMAEFRAKSTNVSRGNEILDHYFGDIPLRNLETLGKVTLREGITNYLMFDTTELNGFTKQVYSFVKVKDGWQCKTEYQYIRAGETLTIRPDKYKGMIVTEFY